MASSEQRGREVFRADARHDVGFGRSSADLVLMYEVVDPEEAGHVDGDSGNVDGATNGYTL